MNCRLMTHKADCYSSLLNRTRLHLIKPSSNNNSRIINTVMGLYHLHSLRHICGPFELFCI